MFTLRVDHIEMQLGDSLKEVAPGETLEVAYCRRPELHTYRVCRLVPAVSAIVGRFFN